VTRFKGFRFQDSTFLGSPEFSVRMDGTCILKLENKQNYPIKSIEQLCGEHEIEPINLAG